MRRSPLTLILALKYHEQTFSLSNIPRSAVNLIRNNSLAWLLGLSCAVASAQTDDAPPRVRLNGFATVGVVEGSSNFDGIFVRDVAQVADRAGLQTKPDSRLGLQANVNVNSELELVGQVVARPRSPGAKRTDAVEWAFVSYRPTNDINIRAGRTGVDLFLMSDHRNVGYAYLTARPPVDFYGVLSLTSLDGVDITKSWQTDDALWKLKGFTGNTAYDINRNRGQVRHMTGVVLSRETEGLTLRGTYARAKLNLTSFTDVEMARQGLESLSRIPIPTVAARAAQLATELDFRNIPGVYSSLGLSYDRDNWVATAELMRVSAASSVTSGSGAYVVLGRRLGNVTPYVGFSRSRLGKGIAADPQWGQALAPLTGLLGPSVVQQAALLGTAAADAINNARVDQHTQTLGVRWDFSPQGALKFQHDLVHVANKGNGMWRGQNTGGRARVTSVVLELLF
ncbi:hypothetical protein GCM10028785_10820 [Hydrogenophaga soli]